MTIDTVSAEYTDLSISRQRCRDFLAGEEHVKKAGDTYLPRLEGQTELEYQAYMMRAVFLNATGRTHEALVGQIFLKDPEQTIPADLDQLNTDADLAGNSLYTYSRNVVSEVLAMGMAGTLVDWSEDEKQTAFAFYEAEAILNWRNKRIAGKNVLAFISLKEQIELDDGTTEPQLRVLRLDDSAVYTVELYRMEKTATAPPPGMTMAQSKKEWVLIETLVPLKKGAPLNFIPFVFHFAEQSASRFSRPPLDDLVALNLAHYRLSADHYHGLHYTALPTPWVAGFDSKSVLKLGSATAWVTENEAARAGFLEFTGTGLGAIRTELDRLESSMAVMGARLLEHQKRAAETAEAMAIRQGGEGAVLTGIVGSVSVSLSRALKIALWWTKAGVEDYSVIEDDECSVELNSDFSTSRMTAAEVVSLVSAWMQRGISRRTLFYNLKQGEVIPPGVEFDEEIELIDSDTSLPGMNLDDDRGSD